MFLGIGDSVAGTSISNVIFECVLIGAGVVGLSYFAAIIALAVTEVLHDNTRGTIIFARCCFVAASIIFAFLCV